MRQLCKEKYDGEIQGITDGVEHNLGAIFPGHSLELVLDKRIKEINTKLGGRLCNDKEVVFVEISC